MGQASGNGLIDGQVGEDAAVLVVLAVRLFCEHLQHHQPPQQSQRIALAA